MSNSTHIIGFGPDGPQGDNKSGYTASATGASGPTGATGPAGGIGATGPTGFGFGFSGNNTDRTQWEYAVIGDDNNSLTFFLGGSADSQIPGKDDSLTITGLRGPTGTTGTNGQLFIQTLVTGASGAILLKGISGSSADFKTINSRSDVTITVSNDTITLTGISANSADSIDAGRTGEILVMVREDYADGATGTFFNLSAYPTPNTSTNASLDTLSLQKVGNQREIIKRHGTPAAPVGYKSNERVDINISYDDANVHLIHCGPTTGFINFPDPSEISNIGTTYGRQEELTIILHRGKSHGIVAGDIPNDFCQSMFRPSVVNFAIFNGYRSNIFSSGGSRVPYCENIGGNGGSHSNSPCKTTNDPDLTCTKLTSDFADFGGDAGQRTIIEDEENLISAVYYQEGSNTATGTKLLKDLKFSDGYDIFTFSSIQGRWVINNPTLGITADSRFSLSKTNTGSCCEFNNAGAYLQCNDYVTEIECDSALLGPNVASVKFTPFTLCESSECDIAGLGACCTMGNCVQSDRETCNVFSGFFVPNATCGQGGLDCNGYPCDTPILPTGACCIEDSDGCHSCIDVTEDECALCGGDFKGYDTPCSADPCDPSPTSCKYGACCSYSDFAGVRRCNEVTEKTCLESCLTGLYYGDDSTCCTTRYPRDGIYVGAYCDGSTVQVVYGASTEEVEAQIPSSTTNECKNIILWNTNSPYPESWLPGFATQPILDPTTGLPIHEPSVSQGVCQAADLGLCPNCNCQEQAAANDDVILGTCCLPYRIPVEGNLSCDYIPNYDLQTCQQVGGTWYEETPEQLGIDCAAGIDCNSAGTEGDAPDCIDCDVKGACCFGGNCEYLSGDECDALGGEFQGEGTNCDTVECCNLITGPCCLNDGICIETHPYNCNQIGGVFNGIGKSCDDDGFNCCNHQDVEDVRGACCCSGCPCTENLTAAECQAKNGTDGCSDCNFYLDSGCFDIACTNFECQEECLSNPLDRVSWHIFTLSDTGGGASLFSGGPYDWGNTNFNPSATNVDDVEYLPPITRSQDGFYNTHGWYWSWGVGDDDSIATCEWNTPGSADERTTSIMRKSGPLTYAGFGGVANNAYSYWIQILEKYWDDDTTQGAVRGPNYGIAQGGLAYPIATVDNSTSSPSTIWSVLRNAMGQYSPENTGVYSPAGHITDSQYINPIFSKENLYIPSKQELHFLYFQKEAFAGLKSATNYMSGNVWSSSVAHDDTTYAFYQNMNDGSVGVHKVMDIENPSNSWPNNDHSSVSASAVFFYRIMVGSSEYEARSGELSGLAPGDTLSVGTTNSRNMVYVGQFTPGCNTMFGTSSDDISQFSNINVPRNGSQVCSNRLPEGSCCDCNGCSDTSANQYTCLHKRNNETWPDHPVDKIKSARVKRWKADNIINPRLVEYDDSSGNPVTRVVPYMSCGSFVYTSDTIAPFFWSFGVQDESNSNARDYYNACLEKGVCCDSTDKENPRFIPECQCIGTNESWTDTDGVFDPEQQAVSICGFEIIPVSTCCTNSEPGGAIDGCEEGVEQGDCVPQNGGDLAIWNDDDPNGPYEKTCQEVACQTLKGSCCFRRIVTGEGGGTGFDYECADNDGQGYYEVQDCQNNKNDVLDSIGIPANIWDEFEFYKFNTTFLNCSNNPCDADTVGRCCKYDASGDPIDSNSDDYIDCENTTFLDCVNESPNNQWYVGACAAGPSNPCGQMPSPQTGSCCNPNGSCSQTLEDNCPSNSTWTADQSCSPNPCFQPPPPPPPVEPCCDDNDDGLADYICTRLPDGDDAGSLVNPGGCSGIVDGENGVSFVPAELVTSSYGIYAKTRDGSLVKTTPDIMSYGCPCSWFDVNAFDSTERLSPDNFVNGSKNLSYTAHSPSDCMWIKNNITDGDVPSMEIDYHGGGNPNFDANACQINCCEMGQYTVDSLSQSVNNFTEQKDKKAVLSGGYIYSNPMPLMELIPTNSQSSYYPLPPNSQPTIFGSYSTTNGVDQIIDTQHLRQAHWDVKRDDGTTLTVHNGAFWKALSGPPVGLFEFINQYPTPANYNVGAWLHAAIPNEVDQGYGYHTNRTDNDTLIRSGGTHKYGSTKFQGISGVSTNRFAYACVPYKGLFNVDGENWWTGSGPQNYEWELPSQVDARDAGEQIKALNPSMARSVSFKYQNYSIPDQFQIVQLPWPKGARNKEEAQERIRLYLRALNTQAFITPVSARFGSQGATSEWRQHWDQNENTFKRSNQEDPLWIVQDPFRTGASGLKNDAGGAGQGNRTYEYLNGILMTNRPLHSNSPGDVYPTKSVINTQRDESRGSINPTVPDGIGDMLYHGRESTDDQALSIAEKYLGYKATKNWVLFDSGCVPTSGSGLGSCAPLLYPYCPLRLDAKQIAMTDKTGGSYVVEDEIQKRMEQGYGPGGQGPIAPIVIGISACSLDYWRNNGTTSWAGWVGQGIGSVYDVQMGSCGGGTVTFNGDGDNSAVGAPGNQNGTDGNQTACGDDPTPSGGGSGFETTNPADVEINQSPPCGP